MTSDSATLLALVLERQFGPAWFERWQGVEDLEVRWLAIYLAGEASKGREFGQATVGGAIAEGRAWLPAATRTARSGETIVAALRAARLWPLAGYGPLVLEPTVAESCRAIPYL